MYENGFTTPIGWDKDKLYLGTRAAGAAIGYCGRSVKANVLIVDDEPAIRDNIQFALEQEGFTTMQQPTGGAVLALLSQHTIDLVVLDVGLPDVNGFDLLKEIRKQHRTPVIMLTARNTELDRVVGLEIGADDYVVKPFSPRELSARVKAVLRRSQQSAPSQQTPPEQPIASAPSDPSDLAAQPTSPGIVAAPVSAHPPALDVNHDKRQVRYHGTLLTLSKYEYEILVVFGAHPGQVFTREQLMNRVWEQPEQSLDRTVDAHIKNLRGKLRAIRSDVDPIVTHRGSGYSLREDL
jgi:two-component system catabolic regulation response regulator CreB